jgi:hypothetical protein
MRYNSSPIFKIKKNEPFDNLMRSGSIVINANWKSKKKYNGYLLQAKHSSQQPKRKLKDRPATAVEASFRNWEFLNVKTMRLINNNSECGKID